MNDIKVRITMLITYMYDVNKSVVNLNCLFYCVSHSFGVFIDVVQSEPGGAHPREHDSCERGRGERRWK